MVRSKTGLSLEYIIHPGETLCELLEDRGISESQLASQIGFSTECISDVIHGRAGISVNLANALGTAFSVSSQYWLNMQNNYSRELEMATNPVSEQEFLILKGLKTICQYMASIGELDISLPKTDIVYALRRFLSVDNLAETASSSLAVAFRQQTTSRANPHVLYSWIKICEHIASKMPQPRVFSVDLLQENLPNIKALMFLSINDAITELTRIFALCGVKFGVVRHFPGAPVHGFIEKADSGAVILFLTIRGAYADKFWFTLFHEIAHILNGDLDQQPKFVDYDFSENDQEKLADKFARDTLIDPVLYAHFVENQDFSYNSIKTFSDSAGVLPGIVIGRLQLERHIKYSNYNNHRAKYSLS